MLKLRTKYEPWSFDFWPGRKPIERLDFFFFCCAAAYAKKTCSKILGKMLSSDRKFLSVWGLKNHRFPCFTMTLFSSLHLEQINNYSFLFETSANIARAVWPQLALCNYEKVIVIIQFICKNPQHFSIAMRRKKLSFAEDLKRCQCII